MAAGRIARENQVLSLFQPVFGLTGLSAPERLISPKSDSIGGQRDIPRALKRAAAMARSAAGSLDPHPRQH